VGARTRAACGSGVFGGPRTVRTDLFAAMAAIATPVLTLCVLLYTGQRCSRVAVGMGNTFGPGETGRRCFHLDGRSNFWHHRRPQKGFWAPVMRVTTISQEASETGCSQANYSIMPGTCKLHGPASHCALAFLLDATLPSVGGNSQKYAKSMLFEGTKMLGTHMIMWFAGRDQHM